MTDTINRATGEIAEDLNAVGARRLTDKIKVGVEGVWHLIEEAYTSRAWAALGYKSWDDYCTREFGTSRLRLPRENRPEVVSSLRDAGLSIPAIATATGLGVGTVHRTISAFPNGKAEQTSPAGLPPAGSDDVSASETIAEAGRASVEPPRPAIVGTDGKTYQASQANRARPRPAAETFLNTIESLAGRAARETQKLTADQIRRVKPNAAEWIGGIRNSIEVLQDLVNSLEEN